MNTSLYRQLQHFEPFDEQEAADRSTALYAMEQMDDLLTRDNLLVHFTASPWIVDPSGERVLLVYHRIYDSWGWCGGHCDGDADLIRVAKREGQEESGLSSLRLVSDKLLGLDVLDVPRHVKHGKTISCHLHINFTFLFMADDTQPFAYCEKEVAGARWVRMSEVAQVVREEAMRPVYEKLNQRTRRMLGKA